MANKFVPEMILLNTKYEYNGGSGTVSTGQKGADGVWTYDENGKYGPGYYTSDGRFVPG